MNLSISNIAWTLEDDDTLYGIMKNKGFSGLEIAPTRIFPENPYDHIVEVTTWANNMRKSHGLVVSSMQSIWFGRQERLFGTDEERTILLDYTKKAIVFAESIGCKNLVFGCPRNRNMPEGAEEQIAISFFKEIGDYAYEHNTVIGMEANPPIYNTNYINDTATALDLIEKVDSKGFLLNLDVGTMVENNESVTVLAGREHLINHVHISEPGLKAIEHRSIHKQLYDWLKNKGYEGFISIEVGKRDNTEAIEKMMDYVKEIFG